VRVVAEAEDSLREVARRLESEVREVECSVRYGAVAQEILDHAEQRGADLIAMSTHGRSGLPRAALGSVAETVLHRSRVPVLLLPLAARSPAGASV